MILPPDPSAPRRHSAMRFPPLGPAVVAACVAQLGLRFRTVDLVLDGELDPLPDAAALEDAGRLEAHLGGARDVDLERLANELVERIERRVGREPLVAISVDRGSQIGLAALLGVELKRRWSARIVVGGVSMTNLRALLERTGAIGPDIVTTASTPPQIAGAFATLLELPEARRGPAIEPSTELVQLVRGGMRAAPSAEGWPLPDFSIYELDGYRRDPLATQARADGIESDRALGPSLVLPYFFSFECQFSCAFCQTGGTQESKPASVVVRELATLAERWGTRDFLFFDTQINLLAEDLSRELVAAKLDLRWSDSFRVRPLSPGLLSLMAEAGCASITVGVESASERVLKSMVKGHRPEHASEMVREAHAAEMLLRINVLTCYPGESRADLDETLGWIREHAAMIDDLAPSSFYLTADSPVGRKPERHGIVLRGARPLRGPTRFRKSPDSLEYDEVGGMTWEEREPLLEESEALAFEAWRSGRAGRRTWAPSPSTMLALRRRFATKAEIERFLEDAPRPAPLEIVRHRPRWRATLVEPKRPELARVLDLAFEAALPAMEARLVAGAPAHVLLWGDGSTLFFRGTVSKDTRGRPRTLTLEEHLGSLTGPAASDARATLCRQHATVDLAEAREALGRVALISFLVADVGEHT